MTAVASNQQSASDAVTSVWNQQSLCLQKRLSAYGIRLEMRAETK